MAREHTTKLPPDLPRLLTGEQVMQAIGVDRKSPAGFLMRLRRKGLLKSIRVAGGYRYTEDSVRDLLTASVDTAA